ncbi:bifunctional diaminohydroxyphosphoribosylaminopyrimidine deaminase/5-amino-6-(5-phosphoribosylamino)uracil reductase RibD [Micromonospora sp. NBC_01638]|uniref:bifunctional diaminohydroxyphosphoribosylaminopyrimidine deaminase/5-amino-6-(5-phosphoribosylamino)uracil reductase RibD n=1 Tax=Micromonospora sp. NBC_01638 TaxID=2975982 RepID=UPI003864E63A|nr:bifunctional diaminohydroxyphosphoribosylaminopyrimidine deaminase/5-amino-6-(5-phosphoribosylamino)uracil reductase RibD [Micromonospora sp. NBC_01638]
MASDLELSAMRQAITLSALGLGTTSPNPPVGCVILDRHGTVVGAGFHRRKGEPHAEAHALNAAGGAARGGTAVVTLEPCNHVGVTPACRQELINAGVSRVVIAVMDPTSRGEGGASMLTSLGVEVESDVLRDEALTVLGPWLTATVRRRPYLTWAFAVNRDHQSAAEERLLLDLRANADLVIADKILDEGVPGGHASAHFAPPGDVDISAGLSQWLSTAYEGGVRSVFVVGQQHAVALRPHLHAVDELVVAVPRTDPSQALEVVHSGLMPIGFRVVEVAAHEYGLTARMRCFRV